MPFMSSFDVQPCDEITSMKLLALRYAKIFTASAWLRRNKILELAGKRSAVFL